MKLKPVTDQSVIDSLNAMPDDRSVDKQTGTGMTVRAAVATARTPEDKLATIRNYYPDAQPYGDDNFVFTNPETGRPTLMNEQSWMPSMGDVASFAPTMYEIGGGVVGGALAVPPAVVAAPATGGASLFAVPAGIGLGAAIGRETADVVGKTFLDVEDTRGTVRKVGDAATTAGLNAVGAKVGEKAVEVGAKAFGPIKRALGGRGAQQVARDMEAIGAPVTAGTVTGNRGLQMIETGVSNTPGGASTMQNVARGQSDAASHFVDDLTNSMGGARTAQGAGETIQDAAGRAAGRFETRQDELYRAAFDKIGNISTDLPATRRLYSNLINEQRTARGARNDVINPVLNKVRSILAPKKVKRGDKDVTVLQDIDFDALRRVRTDIGRMMKAPLMGRSESAQQDYLKALYGALSDDIFRAAERVGPEAVRALKVADKYTRFNLSVNIPVLEKIAKLDAPEKAYQFATGEAQKGGSKLFKLRRNFKPEEWDTVAATVLDRLGEAAPSARGAAELGGEAADFSAVTFMTNWNKLSSEAKQSLFGGKRYADLRKSLDMLTRTMDRIKDTQRMSNPSGTARNIFLGGLLATAGSQALAGDLVGATATAAGGTIAPYVTARMMTSPKFVRWLVGATNSTFNNPNTLPSLMGRLGAIASQEPEIAQEIFRLQSAVQAGQSRQ